MDIDAVYTFEAESYDELKQKTFSDIDGEDLKKELAHFKSSIGDLSGGGQKNSLDKRGFVISINGAWGAGKSTATWALINEIVNASSGNFIVIDRSLLPFGSVNESISTFLNDFATILRNENLIDITSEIDQFILESTPETDIVGVTASFGPVSLSRSFGRTRNALNTNTLINKFKKLCEKSKSIVIVLDDLDRLRPSEIVDILRMVEKLRVLPGVIVLLPMFKSVINKAIASALSMDEPSAATFLRKLTDAEINVDNNINDLKTSFNIRLRALLGDKDKKRKWGIGTDIEEVQLSNLVWAILLHIMIISETVSKFSGASDTSAMIALSSSNSDYLQKMVNIFQASSYKANGQSTVNNPYPVWTTRLGGEKLTSIGQRWQSIRDQNNNWMGELNQLLDWSNSASVVTTDDSIVDELKTRVSVDFTKTGVDSIQEKEKKSKIPIFVKVFLPLLNETENEPLLTENYKRRDINIIAHRLAPEVKALQLSKVDEEAMRTLFELIKSKYNQFRG